MKNKNIITVVTCGAFLLVLSLWCFFGAKETYSESERRVLAKFPQITWQTVASGKFADGFEAYATDTFPVRDTWRSIKAYTSLGLFKQKDNNDIFLADGHISKLEYPMNTAMLDHAISLFTQIKEKYLGDNSVYFCVIPDKNKDLAQLKLNYPALEEYMQEGLDFATPISVSDLLTPEDYYDTDTHWRQEKITDVVQRLATAMGTDISAEYTQVVLDSPFYGVYAGQSALYCEPDTIVYLTNDTIAGLQVEGADAVYDLKKADSRDPYEMFLSGNQPVTKVINPQNPQGKRLILFRDSFGSSIAPLLAQGYSEITLVDLRYINSQLLDRFVDFENADVLFLYSTILLNNSLAMK